MHFTIFFIACFSVLKMTFACNGYTLKLNYVRNCVADSVYQVKDFDVTLDKDCNIVATGCVDITKPFKTAVGKYSLKKPPMPPMEGEMDFCELAGAASSDPTFDQIVSMIGLPKKCPVTAPKKGCAKGDKKINISKYKNQIGLASGTSEVKLDIDHDTGKTCVEISLTVKKGRRN